MIKYMNNESKKYDKLTPPVPSSRPPPKKPSATSAVKIFAEEHPDEIGAKLAERLVAEGVQPKGGNLKYHQMVKDELFDKLSNDQKADYHARAAIYNESLKKPPLPEHIYGCVLSN